MREDQRLWTRNELLLVINLYSKLTFGLLHQKNIDVIKLASRLGRTPGSVAYKLVNIASLDPKITSQGKKGASNSSKLDQLVWAEFSNNWDTLFAESESLLGNTIDFGDVAVKLETVTDDFVIPEGRTRMQTIAVRANQSLFRQLVMSAYENRCCITGISEKNLLIASHIKPWSMDDKNRLNPRNGLALNALHDKAFDCGLLSITPEYKIQISSRIFSGNSGWQSEYFERYHNQFIKLPNKFEPAEEFLSYHYQNIFMQ
ncbi:HNH endonuclease [Larkinella sp. GY13]|uniref:HNH endonuclease n=1 Tax=Larkinella sp. GY13 TaxID=3453720 RepID=UPI003EE872FC